MLVELLQQTFAVGMLLHCLPLLLHECLVSLLKVAFQLKPLLSLGSLEVFGSLNGPILYLELFIHIIKLLLAEFLHSVFIRLMSIDLFLQLLPIEVLTFFLHLPFLFEDAVQQVISCVNVIGCPTLVHVYLYFGNFREYIC